MRRLSLLAVVLAILMWASGLNANRAETTTHEVAATPDAPVAGPPSGEDEEQTDPHVACDPGSGQCIALEGCGYNTCEPGSCDSPLPDCSGCAWYEGEEGDPENWQCGGEVGGINWDWDCDCCMADTPIIISLTGDATLTNARRGVPFDLDCDGVPEQLPWPRTDNEGWLVLDRNGNGRIDDGTELFGNRTPLPDGTPASDGFAALRALDDNGDGRIDASDRGFAQLRLWLDSRRDGVCEPADLVSLQSVGIDWISVNYRLSRKKDRWGNVFRYRAKVHLSSGREVWAYDVFLNLG